MKRTLAEEIEIGKNEAREARTAKLTKDRKNRHGKSDLAATDGLKVIRKPRHEPIVDDDDQPIDLRRVTKLRDLY